VPEKIFFLVPRFYFLPQDFISCPKIQFLAQRFYSLPKDFISCPNILFLAQIFYFLPKDFISCPKILFLAQRFYFLPKDFISYPEIFILQYEKCSCCKKKTCGKKKLLCHNIKKIFVASEIIFLRVSKISRTLRVEFTRT